MKMLFKVLVVLLISLCIHVLVSYLREAGLFFIEPLRDPIVYLATMVGVIALSLAVWQLVVVAKGSGRSSTIWLLLVFATLLLAEIFLAVWLAWRFEANCDRLKENLAYYAPGCPHEKFVASMNTGPLAR
jgi:hypothetical protein